MSEKITSYGSVLMKNIKISEEAHKRLKTYCAENGLTINEFATLLIETAMKKIAPTEEEFRDNILNDRDNF